MNELEKKIVIQREKETGYEQIIKIALYSSTE